MRKFFYEVTNWTGVLAIGLVLGISLQFAQAWVEPTEAPPEGNVHGPVTVGPEIQTKEGGLIATTMSAIQMFSSKLTQSSDPSDTLVTKSYVDAQSGGGGLAIGRLIDWITEEKHYFFTEQKYTGNLGGQSGGNDKCNTDANALNGKEYVATLTSYMNKVPKAGVGYYNDTYGKSTNFTIESLGGINSATAHVFVCSTEMDTSFIASCYGIQPRTKISDVTTMKAPNFYRQDTPSFWKGGIAPLKKDCKNWTTTGGIGETGKFKVKNRLFQTSSTPGSECFNKHSILCIEK